jgi:hypothetical protein
MGKLIMTLYTVILTNNSPETQDFFFFQHPVKYQGGSKVYSNSIYSSKVRSFKNGGSQLTFELEQQFYAGVQDQAQTLQVGQASGTTASYRKIALSPDGGKDAVTVEINPLGLGQPVVNKNVQSGAFRISTPTFNPVIDKYNLGLATKKSDGEIILSTFINAEPNENNDIQPIEIFYVSTGSYKAGTVVNFTSSSAESAMCDATTGITTFSVTYNANGTWTVEPKG